ncbi:Serine/threonine-protein phosphatase 6 regulatory ankyrin repeat subunit B [Phytophthora nicotianae]|uniref:Serine/threonine-protein phosphatase 6 regulatory ankyrin repeat subunit B n=1 Tax=Phytophthora nicotianae TaxID=4792 RepID=A0A0W8BLH3_PHYNI|nr:Serine/threonine-protein phosphatase 6 regulatory ankyrin repeat subunit B [Phytophthora nicotianae]KUF84055.1 Serine/threonine-protein phosphatase 6 regulatory ankyrin repeat subunit B [Phytophthora nicotianae]
MEMLNARTGHPEVVSSSTTSLGRRRSPPLHSAALNGDVTLVRQMLEHGEDADTRDEWTLTPIMSMFVRHALQETRCIFQERNPVRRNLVTDCREEDSERTATTNAVLGLFLQHGALLDARTKGRKSALHYAICDGLYEAAKILLDAGATIDAQDKDGRSPLYCVVQERSLLVTNLLVSYGASIDLQDRLGVSPLSLVIEKEYVNVMQIFLNHHALGNTEMMTELDELDPTGQSFQTVTVRGESCFHFAARLASVKELELLLHIRNQLSGDGYSDLLNSTDCLGATPLFAAATTTESRCVRDKINQSIDRKVKMQLLLSHGAMLLRNEAFPGGSPFRRLSRDSGIILCAQVRRCLVQWFAECESEIEGYKLRGFCTNWITHVPVKPKTATTMTVLHLSVCAGYAIDVLPLVLMLPQNQAAITSFLQSLECFITCSNGLQFDCLAHELSASWA